MFSVPSSAEAVCDRVAMLSQSGGEEWRTSARRSATLGIVIGKRITLQLRRMMATNRQRYPCRNKTNARNHGVTIGTWQGKARLRCNQRK